MSGTLRLTNIRFRAGPMPGKPPLELAPSTVVVLVGPNNSGKSLALREIDTWCFGQDKVRLVVDSIEVDFPADAESAEKLIRVFETSPPADQGVQPGRFWIGLHTFRQDQRVRQLSVDKPQLANAVTRRDLSTLRAYLTASYTVRLDGRTRFSLVDPQGTGDLQQHAQNHLWALFKDDSAREKVRQLTAEAFGLHFVIDPTAMQHFRIRMSDRPPATKLEEQSLEDASRKFHGQAIPISELSDGVQAFVGLISAVMSLPHKIILIDEPDAFLHPPLARRLGGNLARIARERNASLIAATHSPEFLVGCLAAVGDTTVVRVTYEAGVATARALEPTELALMTRDPLLRSTGVLSALFHRAAVVTESDADRAFYDEMNRRLVTNGRGIRDAVFLNAQNYQTIRRLVGPLRRIGIPAAAVVDLDVIEQGGSNWEELLAACRISVADRIRFEGERAYLAGVFAAMPVVAGSARPIKAKGINALSPPDKARAAVLFKELATYGLFLVPVGELERWLPTLGAAGHGPEWLTDVFQRIGQEEIDRHYLHPSHDDVWEFLDAVGTWCHDSSRSGTD